LRRARFRERRSVFQQPHHCRDQIPSDDPFCLPVLIFVAIRSASLHVANGSSDEFNGVFRLQNLTWIKFLTGESRT
jgi:hypothetical protein